MLDGLRGLAAAIGMASTKDPPLPYAEVSETEWNSQAAATWRGTIEPTRPNSLEASGPCPRCEHDADGAPVEQVSPTAVPDEAEIADAIVDLGLREYTFTCNCSVAHPEREKGKEGCGAYWNMVALWNQAAADKTKVAFFGGSPATAADRREADELRELDESELDRVRAAADKWKTGLATLLALIGTVSVVKGRDSFKDLDIDRQHAIIIILGVVLALAAIAALLAMRAAYGPLGRRSLGAGGLRELRRQEAADALRDLRLARTLTVLALIGLAAAVGLTWWSAEGKAGLVSVERQDESIVCGTLVDANAQRLRVKVDDQTTPIPLGDIKAVEFVQEC